MLIFSNCHCFPQHLELLHVRSKSRQCSRHLPIHKWILHQQVNLDVPCWWLDGKGQFIYFEGLSFCIYFGCSALASGPPTGGDCGKGAAHYPVDLLAIWFTSAIGNCSHLQPSPSCFLLYSLPLVINLLCRVWTIKSLSTRDIHFLPWSLRAHSTQCGSYYCGGTN